MMHHRLFFVPSSSSSFIGVDGVLFSLFSTVMIDDDDNDDDDDVAKKKKKKKKK